MYADAPQPHANDRVVDAWIRVEAYRLYTWDTVTRVEACGSVGAEGSVNKLFWSELDVDLHETALDLLGPALEPPQSALERIDPGLAPAAACRPAPVGLVRLVPAPALGGSRQRPGRIGRAAGNDGRALAATAACEAQEGVIRVTP